nr:Hsp20/alpha crystallin family protein [uncultured Methanospirillum sp.]
MERLYFQHVYEELEVMRNYMDSLFQQIQESNPIPLLPSSSEPSRKLLPGVQDNLQIQIVEYKDEIVVSAEMIPGDLKRDITINLIHPMALQISCVRREWKKEDKIEYTMCEHSFGYISQIIPLPSPVTSEGTYASLKNGILKVHLKKCNENPER